MTHSRLLAALGTSTMILLGACAPAPAPTVGVIYAEPTFDKFGNPTCRPGDVSVGGAYTADLPLCSVIGGASAAVVADVNGADDSNGGIVVDPDDPIIPNDDDVVDPDDPIDPNGRNQNQNQNENQNRNQSGA